MTELEARQFKDELKKLCLTYEKLGSCRIDLGIEEQFKGRNLSWVTVNISLKISK